MDNLKALEKFVVHYLDGGHDENANGKREREPKGGGLPRPFSVRCGRPVEDGHDPRARLRDPST